MIALIKPIIIKHCNRETVTYLICGALTMILSIIVFWLCDVSGFNIAASNTISTAAAVTFAYFANKIIVFRSASWSPAVILREIFMFMTGRFGTYISETLLLIVLVDFIGFPGFICKMFTIVLVIIANYVISKRAVFIKTG